MDTSVVYMKTLRGYEAFTDQAAGSALSPAQRTVLILIDSVRTAQQIVKVVGGIGNGYGLLAQLSDLGLITPKAASVPSPGLPSRAAVQSRDLPTEMSALKRAATKAIATQLGAMGDKICLKVESAKTITELDAALETARMVVMEYLGKSRADAFEAQLIAMRSEGLDAKVA